MITCYTLYIVVCNIFGQFFFSSDQLQLDYGLTRKKLKKPVLVVAVPVFRVLPYLATSCGCGCSQKRKKTGLNWTLKH